MKYSLSGVLALVLLAGFGSAMAQPEAASPDSILAQIGTVQGDTLLVKGSRGMQMEKVIEALKKILEPTI